jgi:drug/metabolite transporter (DMT)-like permease
MAKTNTRSASPHTPLGDHHHQTGKALVYMVIAMLLLPGLDAFAKLLSDYQSPGQIVLYRFFFQAVFLFPIVLYRGELISALSISPLIQFMRGALMVLATTFFFTALKYMPLAESISIFFVEPMILTILSAILLGEVIRIRRILAIIVGFIGALIVIKPSFAIFGWAAIFPLCAAFCFAFYVVFTRQLSGRLSPLPMQFSAGVTALIVSTIMLCLGYQFEIDYIMPGIPHHSEIWLVVGLGVFATLGHIFLTSAVRYADTGLLAPFQYLEIISAILLGYLIFSDIPDHQTILGLIIIISSGIYLMHRERLAKQAGKTPSE